MKNEIIGIIVAFMITIFMMFITKTSSYVDVNDNILVAILLLFTMSVLGFLIAKGLGILFDKKEKIDGGFDE